MQDLQINITGDKEVLRMFEELPKAAQMKVLKQLMQDEANPLVDAMRIEAPKESGLLRQAIGATAVKKYSTALFMTVGVRRGYRRAVGPGRGGSVKRLRGIAKDSAEAGQFRNPTKYLHLVTGGRKAVTVQTAKVLYSSQSGKFFGKSARATRPNPFVARTFDQMAPQVALRISERAGDLIVSEATRLGSQGT